MKDEKFKLTKAQQRIFDLVEQTNDNYCILGKPGVGKSVLTRALYAEGNKSYTLTAPTGIAALNIGETGRTLHSVFRIPTSQGVIMPDYNVFNEQRDAVANIKYNVKHLIIDEVSMVRADVFDFIDRYMRFCKGNDLPFGGVQVILVGDFFQLKPVVKGEEAKQLKEAGYDSPFVFSSHVFSSFKILTLDEVLRQKGDKTFIEILHAIRTADHNAKHLTFLNKQVGKPKDLRINMCCTNGEADIINNREMQKLPGETSVFKAKEWGHWPAYPIEQELKLKVGAQVMVRVNKADRSQKDGKDFPSKVVNGTIGTIISIANKQNLDKEDGEFNPDFEPYVRIKTEKGVEHNIYIRTWERKRKFKNEEGKWDEEILATYEQMPLIPAWAISVHKSQGQSFDKAHFDPAKIFDAGQGYVALSRVRSLAGLTLERPFVPRSFTANAYVKQFYNEL